MLLAGSPAADASCGQLTQSEFRKCVKTSIQTSQTTPAVKATNIFICTLYFFFFHHQSVPKYGSKQQQYVSSLHSFSVQLDCCCTLILSLTDINSNYSNHQGSYQQQAYLFFNCCSFFMKAHQHLCFCHSLCASPLPSVEEKQLPTNW